MNVPQPPILQSLKAGRKRLWRSAAAVYIVYRNKNRNYITIQYYVRHSLWMRNAVFHSTNDARCGGGSEYHKSLMKLWAPYLPRFNMVLPSHSIWNVVSIVNFPMQIRIENWRQSKMWKMLPLSLKNRHKMDGIKWQQTHAPWIHT